MNTPLSIVLEDTRIKITESFNQIISKSNLPAYLYEGILLDLLLDARKKKEREIISELNAYQDGIKAERSNESADNKKASSDNEM